MHDYSFGGPVVTLCSLFTDRQMDWWTPDETGWHKLSRAESSSWAKYRNLKITSLLDSMNTIIVDWHLHFNIQRSSNTLKLRLLTYNFAKYLDKQSQKYVKAQKQCFCFVVLYAGGLSQVTTGVKLKLLLKYSCTHTNKINSDVNLNQMQAVG